MAKIPDIPKATSVIPVNSVAVVGAGTMGGGIAMVFANAGIPVLLKDADQPALDRGIDVIRKNYASSVKRGRFTQQFVDERLQLIKPVLDYKEFGSVDMVVEAVFEGMQLKKEVFGQLDRVCRPGAILASNTSTLSIDEIASATARPEAVIGTHFFSPANVMRLLEIVRGKASSKEVIATCMQLSKKLGKVGVLVGNCRGFVGNRMFGPYRREAQFLVEEGASIEAVDQALYDFGMAMGPLATGDLGWPGRRLAHPQRISASGKTRHSAAVCRRSFVRNGTFWSEDRRRLVQVRRDPASHSGSRSCRLAAQVGCRNRPPATQILAGRDCRPLCPGSGE